MKDRDDIAPGERAGRDEIAELIRFAGERESVNRERMSNARARVSAHWEREIATRRKAQAARSWRRVGIAAGIVVATGVGLLLWNVENAPVPQRLVHVERVSGEVRVDGRSVAAGDAFAVDAMVQTGAGGRIALALMDGQSVRIDTETQIHVAANDRLELLRGGVYVDSGIEADDVQMTIDTPFGSARDIGTQFQVRIDDGEMSVGVREGLVEFSRPGADLFEIDSGRLLIVSEDGDTFGHQLASNATAWQWVAAISPEFDIDGATLEDYLSWYARESGLTLSWETPSSRILARQSRLSGSIADLSIEQGLDLVRQIAPFRSRISGTTLHITVD